MTYQNKIENDTVRCFQESIFKEKWKVQPLLLLHDVLHGVNSVPTPSTMGLIFRCPFTAH